MPKKVLLISVEEDLSLIVALGKSLRDQNLVVDILIADRWNLVYRNKYSKELLSSNQFSISSLVNYENLYRELNSYVDLKQKPNVDWAYLDKYDARDDIKFNVNTLIRADFSVGNDFHSSRLYFFPNDRLLKYKFVELHLKELDKLETYDLYFSIGTQSIQKAALFNHSLVKKKPFIEFDLNRIGGRYQLYENFTNGTPDSIAREMEKISKSNIDYEFADQFVNDFLSQNKPLYSSHLKFIEDSEKRSSFLSLVKIILRTIKGSKNEYKNRIKFSKNGKQDLCLPNTYSVIRHYVENYLGIRWFERKFRIKSIDELSENYIYFPLHVMPESHLQLRTQNLSELSCIKELAFKIPPSWQIVVKPPPKMMSLFGYSRPKHFYLEMEKLPNVKVVSSSFNSLQLLKGSRAVACIAGTALIEAAIHKKIGIRWASPEFSIIDSIYHISDFNVSLTESSEFISNINLYIQACYELSVPFDMDIALGSKLSFNSLDVNSQKNMMETFLNYVKPRLMNILESNVCI